MERKDAECLLPQRSLLWLNLLLAELCGKKSRLFFKRTLRLQKYVISNPAFDCHILANSGHLQLFAFVVAFHERFVHNYDPNKAVLDKRSL